MSSFESKTNQHDEIGRKRITKQLTFKTELQIVLKKYFDIADVLQKCGYNTNIVWVSMYL